MLTIIVIFLFWNNQCGFCLMGTKGKPHLSTSYPEKWTALRFQHMKSWLSPHMEIRACPVWPCFIWPLDETSLIPKEPKKCCSGLVTWLKSQMSAREGLGKAPGPPEPLCGFQANFPSFPFSGCRSQEFTTSVFQLSTDCLPLYHLGALFPQNWPGKGAVFSSSTVLYDPEGQRDLDLWIPLLNSIWKQQQQK